ncbi:MAG: cellulase family glycosylhydrolase [Proteobacteria bacterium]|jgi:endoglycosylceramidase|nr:cellulase family glycosylhydrolase [Pseudomonadota bacterium]
MFVMTSLFCLFACSSDEGQQTPAQEISPEPWHWLDDGRVVIHRGVNLNSHAKSASGGYHHGIDEPSLALLSSNGFTLVRYLVFWEALEPEDGVFDEAYIDQVRADLLQLQSLNLDVVIDFHQDVWGEGFGATGFPRWTCDEERYANFEGSDSYWFMAYTDDSVIACFDEFWASQTLQERYAQMAAHLVESLADIDNFVGLDVINEPYWGSMDVEAHDLVVLPAFYELVADEVRAVHPTLRLWLAPSVSNNLHTNPRLDISAVGDEYLGFTPHFYPIYAELATGFDGDFVFEEEALARMLDLAQEAEVPTLLGEFGIFSSQGNEGDYVRHVLKVMEARGASTAWWSYDHGSNVLNGDGTAGWLMEAFADPWAHRVPGRFIDSSTGSVEFVFEGKGELVFVAPDGCEPSGDSVVSSVVDGVFVVVQLEGTGQHIVTCM